MEVIVGQHKFTHNGGSVCAICGLTEQASLHTKQQPFEYDPVQAPSHYLQTKISAALVIADWKLDFFRGSVIKYIQRAPYKGVELQDLKKAAKYLSMSIELLEKGELKDTVAKT